MPHDVASHYYFREHNVSFIVSIIKTTGVVMFKTKLIMLSFLSSLVLCSSYSQTQGKKILKFKKESPIVKEINDRLNLTDDQKKQFDDLDLQFEKKMIDLRADVEKSKLTKRELIRKGNLNKNDYLSSEEKILQAENKIQMEKAKLKMDKYSLLDENQKKIFMVEREHDFMFKFDMEGFKDEMQMFKEKMHHLMPCPPDVDDKAKEIEVEIETEEI
jgi:hypothetical protein